MTFKKLKEHKLVKFFTNRYILILAAFIVWMVFFDENSYLVHREFNEEIEKLETANEFYKNKIETAPPDKRKIKLNSLGLWPRACQILHQLLLCRFFLY